MVCNLVTRGDVSATQQNLPSGLTVLGMDESAGHDGIWSDRSGMNRLCVKK